MVRDITLGQYWPGHSLIHRLDARAKILLLLSMIVFLFVADNFFNLFINLFCFSPYNMNYTFVKLHVSYFEKKFFIF